MSDTILLDRTTWDSFADANGNIAVASAPYATAQDVATVVKLFRGEYWYDTTIGVPYFEQILGQQVSVSALKAIYEAEAKTVPNVASAKLLIGSLAGRKLSGQIQVTDTSGTTQAVAL